MRLNIYKNLYIFVCVCVYIYIYIYTQISRTLGHSIWDSLAQMTQQGLIHSQKQQSVGLSSLSKYTLWLFWRTLIVVMVSFSPIPVIFMSMPCKKSTMLTLSLTLISALFSPVSFLSWIFSGVFLSALLITTWSQAGLYPRRQTCLVLYNKRILTIFQKDLLV